MQIDTEMQEQEKWKIYGIFMYLYIYKPSMQLKLSSEAKTFKKRLEVCKIHVLFEISQFQLNACLCCGNRHLPNYWHNNQYNIMLYNYIESFSSLAK